MSQSVAANTDALSQLLKMAVGNLWALAIYRLPGEQEPTVMLQQNGKPEHLQNPYTALGSDGFIVTPWAGDWTTPTVLIKPDQTLQGWNPDIDDLKHATVDAPGNVEAELQVPENVDAPFEQYQAQFETIKAAIQNGTVEKAILSRIVSHALPDGFDAVEALKRACEHYPNAFCYLVHIPGVGQWMGASPEVLINVKGTEVKTVALAGTQSNKSLIVNDIVWSIKEIHEHQLVRTYILTLLQQYCQNVTADGPNTIQAGNLFHLRTDFTANMPETNGLLKLSALVQNMHPTPAISGQPKMAAIKLIADVEPHKRSYYAGFLGPLAGETDIRLFVNLRCMKILKDRALLYVGGGITAGSVAADEWDETNAKALTLLNVIG